MQTVPGELQLKMADVFGEAVSLVGMYSGLNVFRNIVNVFGELLQETVLAWLEICSLSSSMSGSRNSIRFSRLL